MKSSSDLFKEVFYKCDCGCSEFLEFTVDICENKYSKNIGKFETMYVTFFSEPKTFLEWIRECFKKRVYVKEIVLNKKDVKELKGFINSIKL
jgi:hypothetical protein